MWNSSWFFSVLYSVNITYVLYKWGIKLPLYLLLLIKVSKRNLSTLLDFYKLPNKFSDIQRYLDETPCSPHLWTVGLFIFIGLENCTICIGWLFNVTLAKYIQTRTNSIVVLCVMMKHSCQYFRAAYCHFLLSWRWGHQVLMLVSICENVWCHNSETTIWIFITMKKT
jgi:hypothetical protein